MCILINFTKCTHRLRQLKRKTSEWGFRKNKPRPKTGEMARQTERHENRSGEDTKNCRRDNAAEELMDESQGKLDGCNSTFQRDLSLSQGIQPSGKALAVKLGTFLCISRLTFSHNRLVVQHRLGFHANRKGEYRKCTGKDIPKDRPAHSELQPLNRAYQRWKSRDRIGNTKISTQSWHVRGNLTKPASRLSSLVAILGYFER